MNSPHPLQGALDRVDRAVEHVEDFKRREASLGQLYHEATIVEFNPAEPHNLQANTRIAYVDSIFGILLGEIAYNLRAALDYLVFELAKRDSGAIQQNTQFPICDFKERFERVRDRFLTGVNDPHRAAIEELQPYSGCSWTPILRDISNPDKHCQLADRTHGFMVHLSTQGFTSFLKMGDFAPVFRSKRRAMHPANGQEIDVYLATETPIIVEVGSGPKAVVNEVQKLVVSVRRTLADFQREFQRA